MEKVFPEWVQTDPKTGYKSINTTELNAVLVESIKELYNQVQALIEKNKALEERIQVLENKKQ